MTRKGNVMNGSSLADSTAALSTTSFCALDDDDDDDDEDKGETDTGDTSNSLTFSLSVSAPPPKNVGDRLIGVGFSESATLVFEGTWGWKEDPAVLTRREVSDMRSSASCGEDR